MGNLIIKKVQYSGDNFEFISPELSSGINMITGDNGSGKSTFAYLIEYALGGKVKYFNPKEENEKYKEITKDSNNYVLIDLFIDDKPYTIKRFIGHQEILVNDGKKIQILPLLRHKENAPFIFSDWLLGKLNITPFELNLGSNLWQFNFNDLFRLLFYDQDTESKKIFKSPSNENFITDSVLIRKSIFETLLGISSVDFFKKHDELKATQREKELANSKLQDFLENYSNNLSLEEAISEYENDEKKLKDFYQQRELFQKQNVKVHDKTEYLAQLQHDLIETEIKVSDLTVNQKNLETEIIKIKKFHQALEHEIAEIEKIIFTNDKLNLFSMQICPFCMSKKNPKKGHCVCGEKYDEEDYEKFVYNSSEYKTILDYKTKSLHTIRTALDSYSSELIETEKELSINTKEHLNLREKLVKTVNSIEYSGNSQMIDDLNDQILEQKSKIQDLETKIKNLRHQESLEESFIEKKKQYNEVRKQYNQLKTKFENENKEVIESFNEIYLKLMKKSSYKAELAEIDEDYMPIIDGGYYKNKSASVPRRLMYYFTILSLSLKLKQVKHPRFLLIDTPEQDGIDEKNLKKDLSLLTYAIELSEDDEKKRIKNYQVILTTGKKKYPHDFKPFLKLKLDSEKENFILKEKS